MMRTIVKDLDYISARLHARRSALAELKRLDFLCGLRTIPELARALYPAPAVLSCAELQARLLRDLVLESVEVSGYFSGPGFRLLGALLARFQVENLKALIRGLAARREPGAAQSCLIPLPPELELFPAGPPGTMAELVRLLPAGVLKESLGGAQALYSAQARPFFYEAALDRGYFSELLARANALPVEDRAAVGAMVRQEADIFHLLLAARGRFLYGLKRGELLPFHVEGTEIPLRRFAAMLDAPDLSAAFALAIGRALDSKPSASGPAAGEAMAWNRYLRLADRAFRAVHMGFGVAAGYAVIRRVEVMNLITLCEGIRLGVPAPALRLRMLPRAVGGASA